ncbi:MAG: hypothetical protein M1827_003048 [Pycnora praestabilis]|nr:MAG: hypothetical protein M1827_003048 [Pycnora praestabilis]
MGGLSFEDRDDDDDGKETDEGTVHIQKYANHCYISEKHIIEDPHASSPDDRWKNEAPESPDICRDGCPGGPPVNPGTPPGPPT